MSIAVHPTAMTTLRWERVCALDEIEPLWGEAALIRGIQIALFLVPDGRVFAVSNRDPATGSFVMSRGIVGSRGDRLTIASPLHKQVYDLATGECYSSPDLAIASYPVRVDGGLVLVHLPETVTEST